MVDRKAIAEYDRRVAATECCRLPVSPARIGLWRSGRAVRPVREEPPFDEAADVAVIGAGPAGMLMAAALAHRGHRVLVLERSPVLRCASTWNLSRPEFEALKRVDVLSPAEWESFVRGEFLEGLFTLHDGSAAPPHRREFRFDEMLNISLDAEEFLGKLATTPGLNLRLGVEAWVERVTRTGVYLSCTGVNGETVVKARLVIDASGWLSPLAAAVNRNRETLAVYNMLGIHVTAALPRPTSPATGKPFGLICATYEDEVTVPDGAVQPMFERFTDYAEGRVDDGDVVYFFTRTPRPAPLSPLVDLMLSRLPAVLPGFEEGLVDRTYFGHGPAFRPGGPFSPKTVQTSAGDRLLLLGVAAAQYSGLTVCAFGALARNAARITDAVDHALRRDALSFRTLKAIDIDPRERISQEVESLFTGITELDPGEGPGTVNRDWIAFCEAADGMDPELKCEAFRDKIRLRTMNQLIAACAGRPRVIEAMVRNNRGRTGLMVWTLASAYVRLLWMEVRLLFARRDRKYLYAGGGGLLRAPVYAGHLVRFWAGGVTAGRRRSARIRKGGSQ